uniref:Uncharacterized protein n=1 Tax=Rhizophora mucronata TaxID=61149 RepID=A0A2P2NLV5_RHIMU
MKIQVMRNKPKRSFSCCQTWYTYYFLIQNLRIGTSGSSVTVSMIQS